MKDIINAADMISRAFSNIQVSDIENANTISAIWKKVVRGIKNNRDEMYGEKIANHSDVVDFKNGQLLIETDHPGWTQAIQLYSKFIITGMNRNIKELKVESLVFRLKGNTTKLFDVYESQLEQQKKKMEERMAQDEKKLEEFYKKSGISEVSDKNEPENLPDEFLQRLSSLENSVLTNSKNK